MRVRARARVKVRVRARARVRVRVTARVRVRREGGGHRGLRRAARGVGGEDEAVVRARVDLRHLVRVMGQGSPHT